MLDCRLICEHSLFAAEFAPGIAYDGVASVDQTITSSQFPRYDGDFSSTTHGSTSVRPNFPVQDEFGSRPPVDGKAISVQHDSGGIAVPWLESMLFPPC